MSATGFVCPDAPREGHATLAKAAECRYCSTKMRQAVGLPALAPKSMSLSSNDEEARAVVRDPNSTADDLRAAAEFIYQRPGVGEIENLVKHPNCPEDILLEVFDEWGIDVPKGRLPLANANMPIEILREVIADPDANSEAISLALMNKQMDNKAERMRMLDEGTVPMEALVYPITRRGDIEEIRALMSRNDFPMGMKVKTWEELIGGYGKDEYVEEFKDLVADDILNDRLYMASETAKRALAVMDDETIMKIMDSEHWTWMSNEDKLLNAREELPEPIIRRIMDNNGRNHRVYLRKDAIVERVEKEFLGDLYSKAGFERLVKAPVLRAEALHTAVEDAFANPYRADYDKRLRLLAEHPNLSEDDFRRIIEEIGPRKKGARTLMASSRYTSAEELRKLSTSTDDELVARVVANVNTPDEVAAKASTSANPSVAEAARRSFRARIARRFDIDADNAEAIDYIANHDDWWKMDGDDSAVVVAKSMFNDREN